MWTELYVWCCSECGALARCHTNNSHTYGPSSAQPQTEIRKSATSQSSRIQSQFDQASGSITHERHLSRYKLNIYISRAHILSQPKGKNIVKTTKSEQKITPPKCISRTKYVHYLRAVGIQCVMWFVCYELKYERDPKNIGGECARAQFRSVCIGLTRTTGMKLLRRDHQTDEHHIKPPLYHIVICVMMMMMWVVKRRQSSGAIPPLRNYNWKSKSYHDYI